MKVFKNFKDAHEYYKYPSSHRFGSIYNDNGIIRSYSNGKKDIVKDNFNIFYYEIKNNFIKQKFEINKIKNKKIRLFRKIDNYVYDLGLYKVDKFYKNYVKLIK
jgi:hypothetical protein